jgi:hypothetical protein
MSNLTIRVCRRSGNTDSGQHHPWHSFTWLSSTSQLKKEPQRRISTFMLVNTLTVSRVAQSVQCRDRGWTTGLSGFDSRQRRKDFSSILCVHTSSGAHPASCTMGNGSSFPGAKARPGRDADHSPPSNAEVVNE